MATIFSGRSRTAVAAFALGLGTALSFAGQAVADPKVLAKVDGQPITDEDLADANHPLIFSSSQNLSLK